MRKGTAAIGACGKPRFPGRIVLVARDKKTDYDPNRRIRITEKRVPTNHEAILERLRRAKVGLEEAAGPWIEEIHASIRAARAAGIDIEQLGVTGFHRQAASPITREADRTEPK